MLILLSLLSYDIWFYISHIILHSKIMYKYHSIHHSKTSPTYIDTYIGHPIEDIIQGVGMFLPCAFYKYTIMNLVIAFVLLNIRGLMRHDERFVWLIGNHHLLHHKYPKYNFGTYWIDTLFSTKYPNEKEYRHGLLYV
jgi:lathosterol oxidase